MAAERAPKKNSGIESNGAENRDAQSAPTFTEAATERRRIAKEAITKVKQQSREQTENATDRLTEFERALGVINALPADKRLQALEHERQFMLDDEYRALRESILDDEYRALAKTTPDDSSNSRKERHAPRVTKIEDADDLRVDFEGARDAYISAEVEWKKAQKQHKKRGAKRETGLVSKEMAFERAKREYEQIRATYTHTLYREKLAFLKEEGLTKKDPGYETEHARFQATLLQEVVLDEQDRLAKARVEGFTEEKRTWFRDLLAAYAKRPTYQKVLISTALVSGFVATGGALGLGAGFASGGAAAVFAGQRAIRGMIAGKAAGFVGGMVKTLGGARVEQWNAKELQQLEQNFKVRIAKAEKKPDEARSAREWDLLIHDSIAGNNERIKELTRRHRNVTRWAIAGAIAAGGSTGLLSGAFAHEVNAQTGISPRPEGPLEVPPDMRRAPEYARPVEKGPLEVPPEMRRPPEYARPRVEPYDDGPDAPLPPHGAPRAGDEVWPEDRGRATEETELPTDTDAGPGRMPRPEGPLEVPPEMRRAPGYTRPGEKLYDDGPSAPLPPPEAPRAGDEAWPEEPGRAAVEVEGVPHSPEIHDYVQRPEVEDVPHSPEIHEYEQGQEVGDVPHSPELHDYPQQSMEGVPHSPELHEYAQGQEMGEARVRPALGETAAQRGDSVWRMLERELASKWGNDFTDLRQGERDYIVDALKDRIAEHPDRYGMAGVKDINKIQIGQRLDLGAFGPQELQEISDRAQGLKPSAVAHIEQARAPRAAVPQEAVASKPPGGTLTAERVISLDDTNEDAPDRVLSLEDEQEDIETAKATPAQIEASIGQNMHRWQEMGIREKNLQALEGINRNAPPMTVNAFLSQVAENPDERWETYKHAPEDMNLPGTGLFKAFTYADYKSYSALAEDLREIIAAHPAEREEILKMTIPDIARHYNPQARAFMM